MLRKESENIVWLEFELLAAFKNLVHGVLLRHGGYSTGPFASLNLSFTFQDIEENKNVKANREKIRKLFELYKFKDFIAVNGNKVVEITKSNKTTRPVCDGLATKLMKEPLLVTHADCQAALFYDPIQKAIANVHSGWRGNVLDIYGQTIQFMEKTYGSSASDIHVCISPSLGPEDAQFLNYRTELPEDFWRFQIKPFFFDLWNISKHQLLQAGVLEHHIQISGISTLSNPQDYFSYRREKVSGRHGTFIALRK